ncbi:uncharacterized protein [Apostichopus japonicus]|uniref:uncharacterized protein n=1 Tax=Stichopus japonicus TaxID=307972 RepID=UPI003AB7B520
MEFDFNINQLIRNVISVFDRTLQPHHNVGDNTSKQNLEVVIDAMGKASAKAQGLGGAITTAYKMRYSDHRLYVMKESHSNSGRGSVVGILKVGRKVLFVLDHHSNQVEMKPMCILDFYVHESCQRRGYGKQLFQHMLNAESIEPQHFAIDRPSKKFTSFLMKHYRLRATIPQVNNFVIFEGFFKNQPDSSFPRRRSANKPPLPPSTMVVAQSGYRNASTSALWTHKTHSRPSSGDLSNPDNPLNFDKSALRGVRPRSGSLPSARSPLASQGGSPYDLDLTATGLNYSRHHRSATPPSRPGSGKSVNVISPITGNITSVTSSSPITTTANISSRRIITPTGTPPTGIHLSRQDHVVDKLYNGTINQVPHVVPSGNTSAQSLLTADSTRRPNPTAATNGEPNQEGTPPSFITKEGNYCVTSHAARQMPTSWNVLGVPPHSQRHQANQSSSPLYRNSNYRTNRFF